tara:strand:+ start:175 stop:402 length:228 start_codon:yes stop_codon:yes gene_type:complete
LSPPHTGHPAVDELSVLDVLMALAEATDAAAMGMAQHGDVLYVEVPHRKLDDRADAAVVAVRFIGGAPGWPRCGR